MNGKERVLKALAHEKPDRTPYDIWIRRDVAQNLLRYLDLNSIEELYQYLGIDVRNISIKENHPDFEARNPTILEGISPASGGRYIIYPDGRFEDPWKIVRR